MYMFSENGDVKSFARFCDNVYRGNRCVKDTKLMTCYQACVYDHCNNGNPSPKYLRVENLLQPDPDSKKKLSDEVSTDSQFHFFTAPSVGGDKSKNKSPNAFKEQSIFKAFTTKAPSTTPPPPVTSPDPSTTTDAPTTTKTTSGDKDMTTSLSDEQQSPDTIPSVSSLIINSRDTTHVLESSQSSTDNGATPSDVPAAITDTSPVADDTQVSDDDKPAPENSVDDLGSMAPVDGPDLPQQDGPPATLSPEPVKEHHRTAEPVPDVKPETKKDVIYTTPKPSSPTTLGKENDFEESVEKNITRTEELNLAATQNATDTSGVTSVHTFSLSVTLLAVVMPIIL